MDPLSGALVRVMLVHGGEGATVPSNRDGSTNRKATSSSGHPDNPNNTRDNNSPTSPANHTNTSHMQQSSKDTHRDSDKNSDRDKGYRSSSKESFRGIGGRNSSGKVGGKGMVQSKSTPVLNLKGAVNTHTDSHTHTHTSGSYKGSGSGSSGSGDGYKSEPGGVSVGDSLQVSILYIHYTHVYACTYSPTCVVVSLSYASLCVYLSACLPVCLSVCLPTYLFVCLPIYMCFCQHH